MFLTIGILKIQNDHIFTVNSRSRSEKYSFIGPTELWNANSGLDRIRKALGA